MRKFGKKLGWYCFFQKKIKYCKIGNFWSKGYFLKLLTFDKSDINIGNRKLSKGKFLKKFLESLKLQMQFMKNIYK